MTTQEQIDLLTAAYERVTAIHSRTSGDGRVTDECNPALGEVAGAAAADIAAVRAALASLHQKPQSQATNTDMVPDIKRQAEAFVRKSVQSINGRVPAKNVKTAIDKVARALEETRAASAALTSAPPPAPLARLVAEWQAAESAYHIACRVHDGPHPEINAAIARSKQALADLRNWTPGGAETPPQKAAPAGLLERLQELLLAAHKALPPIPANMPTSALLVQAAALTAPSPAGRDGAPSDPGAQS